MNSRLPTSLTAAIIALCVAVSMSLAVDASIASGVSVAPVQQAKKKCKKGYKRVGKKCKKKKKSSGGNGGSVGGGAPGSQQDPVARFTSALTGSKLERVYSSSNLSSSGSERYNFCPGGAFSYHGESFTDYTSSVTDAAGTWQVASAEFNSAGTAAQAKVNYTSNNPNFPSGQAQLSLVGSNQAFLGETEFQRTAGGASC